MLLSEFYALCFSVVVDVKIIYFYCLGLAHVRALLCQLLVHMARPCEDNGSMEVCYVLNIY